MNEIVIKEKGLAKKYQLGTIGYGTLRHDLQAWWAGVRGTEDPNAPIGEKSRLDRHGDFWALKSVTFEISTGDRVGIIGRMEQASLPFSKYCRRSPDQPKARL